MAATSEEGGGSGVGRTNDAFEGDLDALLALAYSIAADVVFQHKKRLKKKSRRESLLRELDEDISDFIGEQYDCTVDNLERSFEAFCERFDFDGDHKLERSEFSRGLSAGVFGPLASDDLFNDEDALKRIALLADRCSVNSSENIIDAHGYSLVVRVLKIALLEKGVELPEDDDGSDAFHDDDGGEMGGASLSMHESGLLGEIALYENKVSWNFRPQGPRSSRARWEEAFFFDILARQEHLWREGVISSPKQHHDLRWILLHNYWTLRDILKLAVMESLPPLITEDLIELSEQKPKYDKVGGVGFVVLPLFRLSSITKKKGVFARSKSTRSLTSSSRRSYCEKDNTAKGDQAIAREKIVLDRANIGIVMMGQTLITAHSPWTRDGTDSDEAKKRWSHNPLDMHGVAEGALSGDLVKPLLHSYASGALSSKVSSNALGAIFTDSVFSKAVYRNVKSSRSKLRHFRSSAWMLFEIADAIADELPVLVDAYSGKLSAMQNLMRASNGGKFTMKDFRDLQSCKSDIQRLTSDLRPFIRVLEHLLRDKTWSSDYEDALHFLADVLSAVQGVAHDLEKLINDCENCVAEYRDLRDNKMNDVLFLLTVVTTVFIPGQFLTGLFGMNFEFNGQLQDPLLRYEHGYVMFWVLTALLTFFILFLFYWKGWISRSDV